MLDQLEYVWPNNQHIIECLQNQNVYMYIMALQTIINNNTFFRFGLILLPLDQSSRTYLGKADCTVGTFGWLKMCEDSPKNNCIATGLLCQWSLREFYSILINLLTKRYEIALKNNQFNVQSFQISYEFVAFELVRHSLNPTNYKDTLSIAILQVYWCGLQVAHYKWLFVILYIERISLIHIANVS